MGRRPHRARDQRRRRAVPEAGAHRPAPAADAGAAQHRVLLPDGARSVPRVLGDRPADLAVDRHDRRDVHAIGERAPAARSPATSARSKRRTSRSSRRSAWPAAARWRCSAGFAACCSRRSASRSIRATACIAPPPAAPRRTVTADDCEHSCRRFRTGPASSAASACSSSPLLDSSFLSFPQVNDILIIVLSTKYPARMPYYAGMTTLGSLVGCFMLYGVARRGGEAFLRKRLQGPLRRSRA